MKISLLLLFAILLISPCTRQSSVDDPSDKFNGYSKYLKNGNLYAIAPVVVGGTSASAYIVNTNTGVLTEIIEGKIIVVDPFSDISRGPNM
jgi:hypothetical protein